MAETRGVLPRLRKAVGVLASLVGIMFGVVSPSDATHD